MRKITDKQKQSAEGVLKGFDESSKTSGGIAAKDDRIRQRRHYRLITPLFGGGVKPGENDPTKLIRETSVRGQLRFWWRATRGNGTLKDMKKREDAIFGSANPEMGQSGVSINIEVNNVGKAEFIFESSGKNPKPLEKWKRIAYTAYPALPTEKDPLQKSLTVGVEFTLTISFRSKIEKKDERQNVILAVDDVRTEVEAALWAWETFGGVGARTRRGFGALELISVLEDGRQREVLKYEKEQAKRRLVEDFSKHCLPERNANTSLPRISSESELRVKTAGNADDAWAWAIDRLRFFRQFRRDKNTNEFSLFGRSQWPEAGVIRSFHRHTSNIGVDKLPRGEFGLPIIFHFPQKELNLPDHELNLAEHDRLASPLILKPMVCSDGAIAIALLIDSPRAGDLEVELKADKRGKEVSTRLDENEARQLTDCGLTPLERNTNVLAAFLDFFEKGNQAR